MGRSQQALLNRRAQRRPTRRRPRLGGYGVSPATPVTFPGTALAIRVMIALGADLSASPLSWAWEDITSYVRFDLGIELTHGRSENQTVTTDQMRMKLDNRDGRFSRRNPTGPYFGLLSMNTPIWVQVDAGSGWKTRAEMFVNSWPTRWSDQSTNDCTVTIECAGALRRLGQGTAVKSPLRRAILATSPEAYWTLEDGPNAETATSAVGGSSMRSTGTVTFGEFADLTGALQTPDITAGSLFGSITGVSATSWHAEFLIKMPFQGGSACARVYTTGGGPASVWRIFPPADASGSVSMFVTDPNSTVLFGVTGATVTAAWENQWHHFAITAEQSGTSVVGTLYADGVLQGTGSGTDTLTAPDQFWANHLVIPITSMAHIAVGSGTALSTAAEAIDGYSGEMAHVRMARVCAQDNIPFHCLASTSVEMGPQPVDTLDTILREGETVDMGVLYETGWGLAYQSTSERYNATAAFELDFALNHLTETPEPADDDLLVRNRWTVSRPDGSEYTAEQDSGPMGTGPGGPGIYDDQLSANVETDTLLRHQAGWRVHLGTVDEDRWPRLDFNLARNPELIDTWTSLPYGTRFNLLHPLTGLAPDTIDAFIEGHSERFTSKTWRASLNTGPASPYDVHVVEATGNRGRVDAANSTLAADATDVATTISVASPAALWRTGAVNFDIAVAGERMTVTDISGGSSPQTFTVTRSVNGVTKAQPSTVGGRSVKVSLWKPGVYAL